MLPSKWQVFYFSCLPIREHITPNSFSFASIWPFIRKVSFFKRDLVYTGNISEQETASVIRSNSIIRWLILCCFPQKTAPPRPVRNGKPLRANLTWSHTHKTLFFLFRFLFRLCKPRLFVLQFIKQLDDGILHLAGYLILTEILIQFLTWKNHFVCLLFSFNIIPSIISGFNSFFRSRLHIRCTCESEGADCWVPMSTAIYRWFSGLMNASFTAGLNAIFFSSTIFIRSGTSPLGLIYCWTCFTAILLRSDTTSLERCPLLVTRIWSMPVPAKWAWMHLQWQASNFGLYLYKENYPWRVDVY